MDRDRLRQVSESIRGHFPQPFSRTEVVLVDVNPRRLFAFWNIPYRVYDKAAIVLGLPRNAPKTILRLARHDNGDPEGDRHHVLDIGAGGLQSRVYVDAGPPGAVFHAQIGVLTSDGGFVALATSNVAALPFAPPGQSAGAGGERAGVKIGAWRNPDGPVQTIDALSVYAAAAEATTGPALGEGSEQSAGPATHDAVALSAEPSLAQVATAGQPEEGTDRGSWRSSDGSMQSIDAVSAHVAVPNAAIGAATGRTANESAGDAAHVGASSSLHPGEASQESAGVETGTRRAPDQASEIADALRVYAAVPEDIADGATRHMAEHSAKVAAHGHVSLRQETHSASKPVPARFANPPGQDGMLASQVGGGVAGSAEPGGTFLQDPGHADGASAGSSANGEFVVGEETFAEGPLALETVLPLSSFVFTEGEGGIDVALEVVAEVHLHGRARPGTQLELFGEPIPLRPDGTFWIRRLLPRDPELLQSLFASGERWRQVDG